jgi:predicted DNA-binding protein
MTDKLFRLNVRLSQESNSWLDQESTRTGLSKSSIMAFALENYIQQKEVVKNMDNMKLIYEKLEDMENKLAQSASESKE